MASRIPTWSGKGAGIRVRRDYAIPIMLAVVCYIAVLLSFFWATATLTVLVYGASIFFSVRAYRQRQSREAGRSMSGMSL